MANWLFEKAAKKKKIKCSMVERIREPLLGNYIFSSLRFAF